MEVSHIAYSALKVNNPKSKTGFIFGGFYLITREVYESLGTHQSVKGDIVIMLQLSYLQFLLITIINTPQSHPAQVYPCSCKTYWKDQSLRICTDYL